MCGAHPPTYRNTVEEGEDGDNCKPRSRRKKPQLQLRAALRSSGDPIPWFLSSQSIQLANGIGEMGRAVVGSLFIEVVVVIVIVAPH